MNKINGILMLLIYICVATALLSDNFVGAGNLSNVVKRTALFGVIGVGVAFVIITGGIDLSIGSMIGLTGCLLAMLLEVDYRSLDEADLLSGKKDSSEIWIRGDAEGWSTGDRVVLFNGNRANQGVRRLVADPVIDSVPAGVNNAGADKFATRLMLDAPLAADDLSGRVQRVYPVEEVDAEFNEIVLSDLPVRVRSRDRVVFFSDGFERPQSIPVYSTFEQDGKHYISLESTPTGFDNRAFFNVVTRHAWPVPLAVVIVMAVALLLGMTHGLLVTKVGLQPFVVTLCGLLIYRGIARTITSEQSQGFGNEYDESIRLLATGRPCSVSTLVMLVGAALVLYMFFRIVRTRSNAGRDTQSARWSWTLLFGLGTGALLAVIGSARFWQGWERSEALVGKPLISILGIDWNWWPYVVSNQAAEMPAQLSGLLVWVFVPSAIAFLAWAINRKPRLMIGPTLVFVTAVLILTLGLWLAGRAETWFGDETRWVKYYRMALVFVPLAFLFGAISYVVRIGLRAGGIPAQILGATATLTGILLLVGKTEFFEIMVPAPFFVLVLLSLVAAVFLNLTIYGRYLFALGRNEQAARFSGIKTDRMTIAAYVICSGCAGLGGILFAVELNSIQPAQHGNFYELYAIAAAVLGGCSLRGGEGTILGVIIGAAVMQVLRNSIFLIDIPPQLEFAIIGAVILVGVIVDEVAKRMAQARRVRPDG